MNWHSVAGMGNTTYDPLAALRSWAARRERLPTERAELIASAWRRGSRNVRALAEAADVARDTVYTDLRSMNIDPTDRATHLSPPPRVLDAGAVLSALDALDAALIPMSTIEDDPWARALYHLSLGMRRMIVPTGPEEAADVLPRLAKAAAAVRTWRGEQLGMEAVVHHEQTQRLDAFEPVVLTADLELAGEDGQRHQVHIDVDTDPATVNAHAVTDPVTYQALMHALELLSAAALPTINPADHSINTPHKEKHREDLPHPR